MGFIRTTYVLTLITFLVTILSFHEANGIRSLSPLAVSLPRGSVPPSSGSPCTYIPGPLSSSTEHFPGGVAAHKPPASPANVISGLRTNQETGKNVYFVPVIAAQNDPNKIMEDFSGYKIHEPPSQSSLSVDSENLRKENIDELSSFSDRILYSEKDVIARRFIKKLMGLSGLSVREDAVGNIFGRWEGYEPELAPVSIGSHIDAGKYDGVVGVLGAIEAINVLKRSSFKPKRSLEVIVFTSEEPSRFGISFLGSRLMAGDKELAELLKTMTVDSQNTSFLEAARFAGYANNPEDITSVFLKRGSYSAFIELHIEQGPILEEEGTSIGVVTAIAAPASIKVDFEGNGGHAEMRNDARLAAAELALAVEKFVLESGSIDNVGTVDTRDIDEKRRNEVIEKIHQTALCISEKRGVKLSEFKIVNQDPPAFAEDLITKATESACRELNLTYKKMISRAYHDSLFMARISPMGMIFIPRYKGYSHKAEEFAAIEDIANGVRVLALTMAKLSLS